MELVEQFVNLLDRKRVFDLMLLEEFESDLASIAVRKAGLVKARFIQFRDCAQSITQNGPTNVQNFILRGRKGAA